MDASYLSMHDLAIHLRPNPNQMCRALTALRIWALLLLLVNSFVGEG